MSPRSYQRGQFFATAKTHLSIYQRHFFRWSQVRPIIIKRGLVLQYTCAFVLKYISPLSKNELSVTATLSYSELLKNSSNEESYSKMFLTTLQVCLKVHISVRKTIDHILHRICNMN